MDLAELLAPIPLPTRHKPRRRTPFEWRHRRWQTLQNSVAFDAVSNAAGNNSTVDAGSASLTISLTVGSITNGVVIAVCTFGLSIGSDASRTMTATCAGSAMTSLGVVHSNSSTSGFVQAWIFKNPSAGANSIVFTVGGSGGSAWTLVGGACSYSGVDQTTPNGTVVTNPGSGTPATTGSVTCPSNGMIVGGFCNGSTITTVNQTSRWKNNAATDSAAGCGAMNDNTSTGALTCAVTSDFFGAIGIPLNPAAGASTKAGPWPTRRLNPLILRRR